MTMVEWAAEIVASVLLADFLSGLAHWLEDSYFTPATPLLGPTIARNILHHERPEVFTTNPWHVTRGCLSER
jgi:ubiquitin-conjugating enzyme E2 variant